MPQESCLHGVLFHLKRQVEKVKSELKLHCLMQQLALTPPWATHQPKFSIYERSDSLPQAFLSKWTKASADCIWKGRKRERKGSGGGREEKRESETAVTIILLVVLHWQSSEQLTRLHPATAEPATPTAALMLTDYSLLALVRSVPPLCQLRPLWY